MGGVLIIILGLKFILGVDPDYGAQSHSVLNTLRADMMNRDMMKSIMFLLIGGGAFYIYWRGWIGRQALAGVIIASSIIDMGFVDKQIIEPDKKSYRQSTMTKRSLKSAYLNEDEVIRFLKQDKSKYRILPLGNLGNENRWSAFQIESIMGYHPAKIYRYNKVKDDVGWNSLGILQMLNVKYIVTWEELPHPAFEKVFTGTLFLHGNYQKANVYQFKYALPRIFFVQDAEIVSELNDQLEVLRKQGFNPLNTAVLEKQIGEITYNPDSDASITYWSPDKIEIQAEVSTDQLMVLSEIYYPEGWKITSHPNWAIHPVNSILRGIKIPSGKHHIVMEFIPDDIRHGEIMTWGSTAILILLLLSGLIKKIKEDADNTEAI